MWVLPDLWGLVSVMEVVKLNASSVEGRNEDSEMLRRRYEVGQQPTVMSRCVVALITS